MQIGQGNLYLTENWLSRYKMWCAVDNPVTCVTYVQKTF